MDDAQRGVGVAQIGRHDAERQVVVELRDVDLLPPQLLVDRVVALDAEVDLDLDPGLGQAAHQAFPELLDRAPSDFQLLVEAGLERGELQRIEVVEREILEVPLDLRHAEPVGERRVDLERLLRDPAPGLRRHRVQGHHVVQAIGELDQNDPHVLGRGQDHLAEGLRLRLVLAHVGVAADLGHAVDELGDLGAELAFEDLERGQRVLEHVVQEPHSDAGLVEPQVGEQPGDARRMGHVRLTGAPHLILVHLGRVAEDSVEIGAVDEPAVVLETACEIRRSRRLRRRNRRRGRPLAEVGHRRG